MNQSEQNSPSHRPDLQPGLLAQEFHARQVDVTSIADSTANIVPVNNTASSQSNLIAEDTDQGQSTVGDPEFAVVALRNATVYHRMQLQNDADRPEDITFAPNQKLVEVLLSRWRILTGLLIILATFEVLLNAFRGTKACEQFRQQR